MGLLGQGWDDPQSQMIMALAGGLLSNNGSQGLSAGLLGASDAMSKAKAEALKKQLYDMKLEQQQMELSKARREDRNEQGLASLVPQFFNAGRPAMGGTADVNAALPADLRIGAQPPIAGRRPQFDVQGFTGAAMTNNYMDPLAALKLQKAFAPESQVNKLDVKDFEPASVARFQQTGNYADLKRMDKLHFGDTGGALVGVNPFTGERIAGYDKTQSPDSKASNALGWANNALTRRGQDLTDARAREANSAGKAPPGYRYKPDGSLEAIPGGPADIKAGEIGAKAEAKTQATIRGAESVLKEVADAKGMVGMFTTGVGSVAKIVPGTSAKNLEAKLTSIKANLGFDRLQQMRDNSPTGGALGQVAVQELVALQSTVASLDQAQSPAQMEAALKKVETHYNNWLDVVKKAGNQAPTNPGNSGTADGGWGIKKVD